MTPQEIKPPPIRFYEHQPILRTAEGIADVILYRLRHPTTIRILNERRQRRA